MKLQYDTIMELQESIYNLNCEVEEQRFKAEELQQSLVDTETRLQESVEKYRLEVEQQKKLVEDQKRVLQGLTQSKYNQDFFLDMGFLVTGFYIVNLSLIHYPVKVLTSFFRKKQQRGKSPFFFLSFSLSFSSFPAV